MRQRFLSLVMATLLLAGAVLVLAKGRPSGVVVNVTPLAVVTAWLVLPKPDRRWFVVAALLVVAVFLTVVREIA